MSSYNPVTCPVCKQRIGTLAPYQTPAHGGALVVVHRGACERTDDPRWPEIAAAARRIVMEGRP